MSRQFSKGPLRARSRVVALFALLLLALGGCDDYNPPTGPVAVGPAIEANLAAFDLPVPDPQVQFFFFRPPLAPHAAPTADFDATLLPFLRVDVCANAGPACVPIASFTEAAARGADRIRLQGNHHYMVNWGATPPTVDPGSVVRVRVTVADLEIGSVTVALVGGKKAGPVPDADVVATAGRAIPITFRIEDNPFLRAHVLRSIGFTASQTAQALVDEFGINSATNAVVLHSVGYPEFDVATAIKDVYALGVDVLLALLISVDILTPNFEPDVFVGARIGTELYGLEAQPLVVLFTGVGLLDVSDPVQAGSLAAKVLFNFFVVIPTASSAPTSAASVISSAAPITPQEAVDAIVAAGLRVETATTAVVIVFRDVIKDSLEDLKHFVRQFKDLANLPAELIAFAEQIPELFGIDPQEIQDLIESSALSAAEAAGAVLKDVYDKTALFAADVMDEVQFQINDVARTLKKVYARTAGQIITIFVDIEKQAREIAGAIADQFEEITANAYAELVAQLGFDPEKLGRSVASFIMDGLDGAYARTEEEAAAILANLQFQAKELRERYGTSISRPSTEPARS